MISLMFFIYIFLGILLIYIIFIFNRLILLKNGVKTTFSQIDVLIKKRIDLLSSLIKYVQEYSKYEKGVFENIAKIRENQNIEDSFSMSKKVFNDISIRVESYPDLKASENYKELFKENVNVENEIMRMRVVYNNVVEKYNNKIQTFPENIIAKIFSFTQKNYLNL